MSTTFLSCLQNLQKSLECSICLEILHDPMETMCEHYFCSRCIQALMLQKTSVPCPLCKAMISRRKLKRATCLNKLVAALHKVNAASKKEIIGTEAECLSSSRSANASNLSVDPPLSRASPVNRKVETFQTPKNAKRTSDIFNKKNVQKKIKKNHSPATPRTPDLLDVLDHISSKSLRQSAPSAHQNLSSTPSPALQDVPSGKHSSNLTGSITPKTGVLELATEDPFDFPLSQNQPKVGRKYKKKPRKLKPLNSNKTLNSKGERRSQKKVPRKLSNKLFKNSEDDKVTSSDDQVIAMIKNAEKHALTVEPPLPQRTLPNQTSHNQTHCNKASAKNKKTNFALDTMPSKVVHVTSTANHADKTVTIPESKTIDAEINKNVQRQKAATGNKIDAHQDIHKSESRNSTPNKTAILSHPPESSKNVSKEHKKRAVAGHHVLQQKNKDDSVSGEKKGQEQCIVQQYVSSSDSSVAEQTVLPLTVADDHSLKSCTGYEHKVSSWLQTIDPLPALPEQNKSSDKESEMDACKETDLEDMASVSQISTKHRSIVVRRKRRKVPPEVAALNLDRISEKNAKAVFRKSAFQQKYDVRNKDKGDRFYLMNDNPVEQLDCKESNATKRQPGRKLASKSHKQKESHAFDVVGLSQGVSPFSTPTKDDSKELQSDDRKDVQYVSQKNIGKGKIAPESADKTSNEVTPALALSDASSHEMDPKLKNIPISQTEATGTTLCSADKVISEPKDVIEEPVSCTKTPGPFQHNRSQESSIDCDTRPVTTTVEAMVHRFPNSNPSQTPKELDTACVSSSVTRLDCIVKSSEASPRIKESNRRLEDMPIVCVRETQENSFHSQAYYVDTPAASQHTASVDAPILNSGNFCAGKKSPPAANRTSVELNLLDFSMPTQSTPSSQPIASKIMETCRMVMVNLNASNSDPVEEESTNPDNMSATSSDHDAKAPCLSDVGLVVDLEKFPTDKTINRSVRTMKEIHATLSQLDNSEVAPRDKTESSEQGASKCVAGRSEENNGKGAESPIFSVYACPSPCSDATAISSCESKVTTSPVTNAASGKDMHKKQVISPSKYPKKKQNPSEKQKCSSKLATRRRKPRIKMVSGLEPQTSLPKEICAAETSLTSMLPPAKTLANASDEKKKCGLRSDATNETSTSRSIAQEETEQATGTFAKTPSSRDKVTDMICTSNGWGGTKLKIRILRERSKRPRASDNSPAIPRSKTRKLADGIGGKGSECSGTARHESNGDSSCYHSKNPLSLMEMASQSLNGEEQKLNSGDKLEKLKNVGVTSQESPAIILDSMQHPASSPCTSKQKTCVGETKRRKRSKCLKKQKKVVTVPPAAKESQVSNRAKPHPDRNRDNDNISSSWPIVSTQSCTTVHPTVLTSCGIIQDASVFYNNVDDVVRESPQPDLAEQNSTRQMKSTDCINAGSVSNDEDVIPNSPLLFAPSQSGKAVLEEESSQKIKDLNFDHESEKDKASTSNIITDTHSQMISHTSLIQSNSKLNGQSDGDAMAEEGIEVKKSQNKCSSAAAASLHQEIVSSANPVESCQSGNTSFLKVVQLFQEMKDIIVSVHSKQQQQGGVDGGWGDLFTMTTKMSNFLAAMSSDSRSVESTPEIWHTAKRRKRKLSALSDSPVTISQDPPEHELNVEETCRGDQDQESQTSAGGTAASRTEITSSLPTMKPSARKRRNLPIPEFSQISLIPHSDKPTVQRNDVQLSLITRPDNTGQLHVIANCQEDDVGSRLSPDRKQHSGSSQVEDTDQVPDSCWSPNLSVSQGHFLSVPGLTKLNSSREVPVDVETTPNVPDNHGVTSVERVAHEQEDEEIRDTPLSPTNSTCSESELVPVDVENHLPVVGQAEVTYEKSGFDCDSSKPVDVEEDGQRFSAQDYPMCIDDSQPSVVESQATPPASMSDSFNAEGSDVKELLRKNSEFTQNIATDVTSCAKIAAPSDVVHVAAVKEDRNVTVNASASSLSSDKQQCPSSTYTTCVTHIPDTASVVHRENVATTSTATPAVTLLPVEARVRTPLSPQPNCRNTTAADANVEPEQTKKSTARSLDLSSPNISLSNISFSESLVSSSDNDRRSMGIMASGIRGRASVVIRKFAKKHGVRFHDTFIDGETTHVIVRTEDLKCDRTLKYLQGIASKIWVVSSQWVASCLKEKTILPEKDYEAIGDNMVTEVELLHAPRRARESSPDVKLLSGFAVHCIAPLALFTAAQCRELLSICGANVVLSLNDLKLCDPSKKRLIVLDVDAYSDSLPDYSELARLCKAEAVSVSWVLESIATFSVQPTSSFPVEEFDSEFI